MLYQYTPNYQTLHRYECFNVCTWLYEQILQCLRFIILHSTNKTKSLVR